MSRAAPVRLLLVRHGQSTWNADGRWQGRADPPLSELGEQQAAAAIPVVRAHAGSESPVSHIWASPLQRARRSAGIVADGLGLEVEEDVRLQEVDAGEWTGLTREQIEAGWPGYLAEHRRPPGFEAREHLIARALEVLGEIAASSGPGPVLVLTHGGLIGAVEGHLDAEWVRTPNFGGREVLHAPDGLGLELGARFLLFDPDAVEVTIPGQI